MTIYARRHQVTLWCKYKQGEVVTRWLVSNGKLCERQIQYHFSSPILHVLVSNAKLLDTLDTLQRNMCALYSKWGVVQQRQIICAEDTIQCLVLVQRALRIMVQSTIPSVELDVLVMSILCLCLNNHPVQQWPLGWWNTSKVTTALHLRLLWSTIVNYVSGMPLLCMYIVQYKWKI